MKEKELNLFTISVYVLVCMARYLLLSPELSEVSMMMADFVKVL